MIRPDCPTRVILVLSLSVLAGADWPQYRCDAGRTAASAEQLPEMLHRQWVRRFPAPQPVFPAEVRLRFDASYEPVVLGKRIFVPSMVTDSVTALDTDTGDRIWQFFAEGPVRFAPVAWEGRVYFVSDDGNLYCVDAASGQLQWKFTGRPPGAQERKILGNGRLVSLWPAWGGPVLHDGVLYFGCGIWSTYGVCIHALDARSGQVIWTNSDSNQIPKANMDHGIANVAGLTPQGYLAVVDDQLVVPCGAQLPAFLDLKTGKLGTYCMGWGGRNGLPKGTWFVAGQGRYLSHSGDLYDITRVNDEELGDPRWPTDFKSMLYPGEFTRLCIDRTNQKDLGEFSQPVFASGVMYSSEQGLAAYDLGDVNIEPRRQTQIPDYRRDDTYPDKWTATFRQQWKLASERKVQIKAGRHLFVSGPGAIEAIRIPQPGEEPQVSWQAKIDGTPHRLLAADGKLLVVTREGSLFAFGPEESANPASFAPPAAPEPPADAWTKMAAEILDASGMREGYALVLGFGSGRLVEQLVRHSDLYVIAIGHDADRADELRRQLQRAGLYGSRASVHVGDPLSYPLPPYLANLVVSEDWNEVGAVTDPRALDALYHPLRPYGGTVCLPTVVASRESLVQRLSESPLAGATVEQTGDWLLLSRSGPLPGSADWTHAEANAAGTGASEDRFIRPPFDLLWFDTPRRWIRIPGAALVRVCSGRTLIKAERLRAVDVYTGRTMWETPLPFPHNANDQFVAVEDAIYLTSGTRCLVLNPATGKITGEIELPAGLTEAWSNVRVWKHFLVAQSGRHVICLNRNDGQLIWKFECRQRAFSVAAGGGRVFGAELANPRRGESEQTDASTRAWDIATGRELWHVAGGSEIRYSPALDAVVTTRAVYRAADGSQRAGLPEVDPTDPNIRPQNLPKPLLVVDQQLLFGTAENLTLYDLATGDRAAEPFLWTRRGCTIPRASSHMITTRVRGNAACIDLQSRDIVPLWNVRAACSNNLFPADGVLNVPSLTGGCTCNYIPVSQAFVPAAVISRSP